MEDRNRMESYEFEAAHTVYLRRHREARAGERRGRLERGHQYAEKLFLQNVWWPLLGHFDDLHPEYEIHDWNRRSQFLDFAYLPANGGKIGIECDGFQSHIQDMDREKFRYALNRDSFLTGMGWRDLYGFSHRKCSRLLQSLVDKRLLRAVQGGTYVCKYETVGHFPELLL